MPPHVPAPLIHDLLDLPEVVRKGDFVQDLTGALADPARTVATYALTPRLVQSFRHAVSIVDSALRDRRSQAAYLHGSFGSGKSHFMALLNLMLQGDDAVWRRPELHVLRDAFPWLGKKRLVQVPIHMLGAENLESKVLGGYARWVAEHHPAAPLPAVYVDSDLFADALRLRETLGDTTFFARLGGGAVEQSAGWGALAQTVRPSDWDAARFDAAVRSTLEAERGALFDALVRSFFQSYTRQGRYLDIDAGLGVMSRHAASLGYDGVVLYLDELVLWLAGRSSDLTFVGREVQKMVKLKEAQDAERTVPIVSFIARQRDLAQFLGEAAQGSVRTELSRNLGHHEGRFESILLADSNLPTIVQHRVLRPKDDTARERLADDFARTWRAAGDARSVLIGSEGDEADFRKVYPFSPALVEALVALSDSLQRERTAIRILMELLVDHLKDRRLGQVVPVGDVFDALAESEDPIDDPVMKARFERARDLYYHRFLPLIRGLHGTESPQSCQRLRDDHDPRLGCSGCPVTVCRNDNRLAKTMLLAALVPEAKPFKGLTVKRLVHLNHGAIATPIPGAEFKIAAERLRGWAAQVGALRVGEQADPEVTIHLSGVDLEPILAKAAEADTDAARRHTLRRLLFVALELPAEASGLVEHRHVWRGLRRPGRVRFGNVRVMDDLRCPRDAEWLVVLDYPFDEQGFTPDDDLRRVEAWREAHDGEANPALVWLPTFFSHQLELELGQLVVLEHILDGDPRRYLGHLRVEDQGQALSDLRSLRAQKEAQVRLALVQAYGLTASADSPLLDPSRAPGEHYLPLDASMSVRPPLASSLKDGFYQIIDAVLEHRYPHHPQFDGQVTAGKLDKVRDAVERLLETPDRRVAASPAELKDLRAFGAPLGVLSTTETLAMLREQPFDELERRRLQVGVESPTVAAVRGWLDPHGHRGLVPEVADLLVWLYAQWSGRSLRDGTNVLVAPKLGQLPAEGELVRPELPSPTEWATAIDRAGQLFGVAAPGRHLSARNLAAFDEKLAGKVAEQGKSGLLAAALQARIGEWADPTDAPRLKTANAATALVRALAGLRGAARVRALATFTPETSLAAMERSLSAAAALLPLLQDDARWIVFGSVAALRHTEAMSSRAENLLSDLARLLCADEINRPLGEGLTVLTRQAGELLRARDKLVSPKPEPRHEHRPKPGRRIVAREARTIADAAELEQQLDALARQLRGQFAAGGQVEIELSWTVSREEAE